MRTLKQLYPEISKVYTPELENCSSWGSPLAQSDHLNGRKRVQPMFTGPIAANDGLTFSPAAKIVILVTDL